MWRSHGTDYPAQFEAKDPVLVPGYMSDEELNQMPKTFVLSSEYDFERRDALEFAKRLMGAGKLAGIDSVPGVDHGWCYFGNVPASELFYKEFKAALDAYTS